MFGISSEFVSEKQDVPLLFVLIDVVAVFLRRAIPFKRKNVSVILHDDYECLCHFFVVTDKHVVRVTDSLAE